MKYLSIILTIISTSMTISIVHGQMYLNWGIQVSPLALINQNVSSPYSFNNLNKGYSVGLITDWLVRGDLGSLRLETNYMNSLIFYQNSTGNKFNSNINAIDIPITYRWTYLFLSKFNIYLGGGTQFIFDKNYKQNYYVIYGFDYEFYTEKIKNPYFFGLNIRQGFIDINKAADNSVRPLTLQLTIGKKFNLTGYR